MEKQADITIDQLAGMVQRGFKEMHDRFDRIENILIQDHQRRILLLEEKIKKMEDVLAM